MLNKKRAGAAGALFSIQHSDFSIHFSMPTYRYESSAPGGKVNSGMLQAADLKAASAQLRARGEYILSLTAAESAGNKGKLNFSFSFGPGAKDVQNFTSQLAVMIRAGISIRAAIEGISEQAPNPKF